MVDVEHHDRDILVLVVELPRLVVELRLHLQSILIKLVFSSILGTRLKTVVVVRIICPLLSRERAGLVVKRAVQQIEPVIAGSETSSYLPLYLCICLCIGIVLLEKP